MKTSHIKVAKVHKVVGAWSLVLLWSLELGAWSFSAHAAPSPVFELKLKANGDIVSSILPSSKLINVPADVTFKINGVAVTGGSGLPTQTGHSGEYLTTNGTAASWATVPTLADGDKGDITVSGSGSVWSIDTGAINFSELSGTADMGQIAGLFDVLDSKAPLDSPVFTGTPELPAGTTLDGQELVAGFVVEDGDFGDITVSGTGTVWTVDTGSINFSELAGTAAFAQLPTGTSATTVAIGNHTHAGMGDASTNTASSVDSEVALFSGTGGKTLKRATGTGIVKITSGVQSTITPGTGIEQWLATPNSANLATAITDEGGTGNVTLTSEQTAGDVTTAWTDGKTVYRQSAALTANRARTLPATSAYVDGQVIVFTDSVTTGAFGAAWSRAGSDTLNGGTSAVTFFTGKGTVRLAKSGTNWEQLDQQITTPGVLRLGSLGSTSSIQGAGAGTVDFVMSGSTTVRINTGGIGTTQLSLGVTGASTSASLYSPATGLVRVTSDTGVGGALFFLSRTPSQIAADQNNYNPGGNSKIQRWSTDASRNVTGLVFTSAQQDGEEHVIVNVGSQNIVLVNESASSTAANRFHNSTGADITLAADQAADASYDSTAARWRVFKRN